MEKIKVIYLDRSWLLMTGLAVLHTLWFLWWTYLGVSLCFGLIGALGLIAMGDFDTLAVRWLESTMAVVFTPFYIAGWLGKWGLDVCSFKSLRVSLCRASSLYWLNYMNYYGRLGMRVGVDVRASPNYRKTVERALAATIIVAEHDRKHKDTELDNRMDVAIQYLKDKLNELR